ncbi:hypothetical protein B0T26DRAFT_689484 [Lasiosphaeria miniovina]|uniref:N-acetyltransferase domain-containing protein n=1 Tax=Lasiosphaeria miniovina TaxID=1954250 RepID=A0AA40EGK4_9PEZI|nr:uncharacterized protein B0T26DRAFT_689484 [Lasiosphaeria miniovina]KAK0734718.1 hypothetical protein B0T26DRAFT_689484 [Lasiosphaeria miniovina]
MSKTEKVKTRPSATNFQHWFLLHPQLKFPDKMADTTEPTPPVQPSQTSHVALKDDATAERNQTETTTETTSETTSETNTAPEPARIAMAPPSLAGDDAALAKLAALINSIYTVDQAGIVRADYRRTNSARLAAMVRSGELAVAWSSPSSSSSEQETEIVLGCVAIHNHTSPSEDSHAHAYVAEFAMLACDPRFRGTGTGRALVLFAEAHARGALGAEIMLCELLAPASWEHPFKARLEAWYARMGYRFVATKTDVAARWPRLAQFLVTESEYRVFEKALV